MNLVDVVEDVLWDIGPARWRWIYPAVVLLVVTAAVVLIVALT